MLTPNQNEIATRKIRSGQLMAGAMTTGALFFTGMIATTVDWSELNGPIKLMSTIAAASAIILFGLAFIVPTTYPQLPPFKKPDDPETLDKAVDEISSMLITQITIRLALLEAGIFANVMPMMFEARWSNIAAIGIGLAFMLINFPLLGRSLRKIATRLKEWR